ncbi:MAG: serine/threonine-protein kinase [Planctomycetes bacterium]|nr:serine/threonine-protein kinase [Planctomycetota bacterium]
MTNQSDPGKDSDTDHSNLVDAETLPPSKTPSVHFDADAETLPPSQVSKGSFKFDDATLPQSSTGQEFQEATNAKSLKRFGDYELLKEIARGGMGVVYKARQVRLNRLVAIKMILAGQFASKEDVKRFYIEAEAAAALDHPGIVPIFEIGQLQDQHFFSMGFVDGGSLADKVKQGPLPAKQAALYTKKVAEAIAYAHSQGVIHRDLKPANVLLDRNDEPKVTDFGLARKTESNSDLTRTGAVMGTPSYMPPEQAAGRTDQVGPLADVYSLGAILYCLLTGRPPFQASNPLDTLMQVIEQEPVSVRSMNPAVQTDLETICHKCLQKDPAKRYASAQDFADDLGRWLVGEPIRARAITRSERAWRWAKRNPYIATSSATVLFAIVFSTVALAVGLFLVNRSRLSERKAKESEAIAKTHELASKEEALQRNAIARDAIDTLLTESTVALADFPATRDLQKRLLAAAAADYERLSQGSSQDEGLQLERVRALVRVADIEALQGNATGSNELYEQSIRSLESKISEMANRDEARTRWELELAKTIARRGLAWDTQDRIDESRVEYEHAQKIFDRLLLANPSDVSIQFFTSRTQAQHADLIGRTESPTTAIRMLQTALAGYERVSPETEPRVTRELAKAKESLARFMGQLGRFDDAIAELESLLQASPSSSESANDDRHLHERTASVHVSLANLHRQTGNLARALSSLEQSRQVYSQLRQSWPDSLEYIENEASVRADIGFLWIDRRNPNRSQGELEQAKSTFEELSQNYPSVYRYATGWGTSVSGLGQIALVSEADAAIAVDLLNRCRSLLQNLAVRESDPRSIELLAAVLGQLARARERAGELDQARESFTLSRDYFTQMIEQRPGEPRYEYGLADVEWHAANFERRAGNKDQAAALFESACTRMRNLWDRYPKNRQYLARVALFDVRLALWSGNVPEQTVAIAQQSIENPIDEEFETPEAIGLRAWVAWQQGNTDQVREQLRELRDLAKAQLPYDIDLNDWIQELENRFASAAR